MIFLVQFGINKPYGLVQFCESLNSLVLIYSKLHSKSCDYLYKLTAGQILHQDLVLLISSAVYFTVHMPTNQDLNRTELNGSFATRN